MISAIGIAVCVVALVVAVKMWKVDRVLVGSTSFGMKGAATEAPASPPPPQPALPAPKAARRSEAPAAPDEFEAELSEMMEEKEAPRAMTAAAPVPAAAAPVPITTSPSTSVPSPAPGGVSSTKASPARPPQPPRHLALEGRLDAPSRIYAGDSFGVSVTLTSRGVHIGVRAGVTSKPDGGPGARGEELTINIEAKDLDKTELEIELLCAGATIAGDLKQRQRLTQERLAYHWSCLFGNPGDHPMEFVARAISPGGGTTLGVVRHRVSVVKVTGLDKASAKFSARAAAAVSAAAGAVSFANEMGLLETVWATMQSSS